MRTSSLILDLLLIFIVSSFVWYALSSESNQKEKVEQEQPQLKTDLLGQTFALTYYPVNGSDQAALSVAQSFNEYQFRITFETDSTYIRRSTKYRNQYQWTQDGDQITLNGKTYQRDGLILRDSIFQIELTPLR